MVWFIIPSVVMIIASIIIYTRFISDSEMKEENSIFATIIPFLVILSYIHNYENIDILFGSANNQLVVSLSYIFFMIAGSKPIYRALFIQFKKGAPELKRYTFLNTVAIYVYMFSLALTQFLGITFKTVTPYAFNNLVMVTILIYQFVVAIKYLSKCVENKLDILEIMIGNAVTVGMLASVMSLVGSVHYFGAFVLYGKFDMNYYLPERIFNCFWVVILTVFFILIPRIKIKK